MHRPLLFLLLLFFLAVQPVRAQRYSVGGGLQYGGVPYITETGPGGYLEGRYLSDSWWAMGMSVDRVRARRESDQPFYPPFGSNAPVSRYSYRETETTTNIDLHVLAVLGRIGKPYRAYLGGGLAVVSSRLNYPPLARPNLRPGDYVDSYGATLQPSFIAELEYDLNTSLQLALSGVGRLPLGEVDYIERSQNFGGGIGGTTGSYLGGTVTVRLGVRFLL